RRARGRTRQYVSRKATSLSAVDEGDACTFEVLLTRFGLRKDAALAEIAEIVHELDVNDGKFEREDTVGVGQLVAGIALAHRDDRIIDDDALYSLIARRESS